MNHFLAQLKAAEQRGYLNGLRDGKEVEKSVIMIALNQTYQFGGDRLEKVETAEQKIWNDEIYGNPDTGAKHIVERLHQIRGVQCGSDKK